MELNVTLDYGSLNAEFQGGDREEIQDGLAKFVEFLNENDELFDGIDNHGPIDAPEEQADLDPERWEDSESDSESNNGQNINSNQSENPLAPLARKMGISVDVLDEIVYVDPEGEEMPQLMADKQFFGDSTTERQRTAAYILLKVWEECYEGEDRMKTSNLKTLLTMADISDNNLYNAWAGPGKGDFNPTGRGDAATVGLTGPGGRQAMKELRRVAQEFNSE